jgi:hypothetical protein
MGALDALLAAVLLTTAYLLLLMAVRNAPFFVKE